MDVHPADYFQHLIIRDAGDALPIAELCDLGKINVICGRNNSGKSTVVSAINSNKRVIGKTLDPAAWEELASAPVLKIPKGSSSQNFISGQRIFVETGIESYEDKFTELVSQIGLTQHCWYADNRTEFISQMSARSIELVSHDLFENADVEFAPRFDEKFRDIFQTVLIPSQRTVKCVVPNPNTNEYTVEEDGNGLVKTLFWLNRQPKHSSNKAIFDGATRLL